MWLSLPLRTFCVFIFWGWNFVSTENGQLNVTRKSDSDLVVFKHLDSDCKNLGAHCTYIYNDKPCDVCHCVAPFSTFVTSENQCQSMREITAESCQTAKVISTSRRIPVLSTSNDRIRMKPIPAFRCETIKNGNPEFFSKNGTWVRMIDVTVSVERQPKAGRRRRSGWRLSFRRTAISRMQSKYPGRIIRTGMRCTMRPKDHFMEFCLVLKIAGTLKVRERDKDYLHPRSAVTPRVSTQTVYTDSTIINTKASTSPSSTPTTSVLGSQKTDEQSEENKGKNSRLIWIITTVLVVIIVVLIAIMLYIYYRHRKANRSNSGSHSPSVTFQKTDGASISCTQPQQSHNRHDDNMYDGDHIYATIPETIAVRDLPACTSSEYQELHKEYPEESSVYQPLVHQHQELQYVDILPEPSPAPV